MLGMLSKKQTKTTSGTCPQHNIHNNSTLSEGRKKKFYELKTEILSDLTSHPGLCFSGQSYVCKQHSVYQN